MTIERTKIIQISDPHFGTTTEEKKTALVNAIREIGPDLVLISGDITQRATSAQFLEARQFSERLAPLDVITVPGNHDISLLNMAKRLLNPYGGFKAVFGGQLDHRWSKGSIEVLGLNSTSMFRHTQGDLLEKDLRKLSSYSKESTVRLLMFHHPMDCAKEVDVKNLLKDSECAVKSFEAAHVDIVLGGHIHDPLARLSDKRYRNVERPMILSVAGTCLSSRTRSGAPNSFNYIDVQSNKFDGGCEASIQIHRYDLSIEKRFIPVLESRFVRNRDGRWCDDIPM